MKKQLTNYRINTNDLQPLPSDAKLERMVLGLLLELPNYFDQCFKYLQIEGIFYEPTNSKIWDAMLAVLKFKMQPDKKNVEGYFTRLGDKEMAIATHAATLYSGDVTSLKQYCLKLFEIAAIRNVIRIGYDLNYRGYERQDALELLSDASNGIGKVYEAIAGMKSKSLNEGVDELTTELAAIASSPDGMLGIKGSLAGLNRIIKGYRNGNMIVIGASSGEGKTTLMLQEISSMAIRGVAVGVISLEMTQSELLLKISCELLNIEIERALEGRLSDVEMNAISNELDKIKRWPMYITETPALKIGEIKATGRMWKNRNKIKILFIDHMHLANADYNQTNAEQKFTDIANQIKELAKELDIPVVALAQLSRKETSEKRMHLITDLKYAGGIEQAADVVILIYRPELHGIETTSDGESAAGKAVIKVGKLRLLRPGIIKADFDGLRFREAGYSNYHTWKPVKIEVEPDPF